VHEFQIPKLGLGDDEEVRVVEWHVAEGDAVSSGEPLLEIETDKAAMDIEASMDGVLAYAVLRPGDSVRPGVLAAFIADADEPYERATLQQRAAERLKSPDVGAAEGALPLPIETSGHRVALLVDTSHTLVKQPSVDSGDLRGFGPSATGSSPEDDGNAVSESRQRLPVALDEVGAHRSIALVGRRGRIARSMTRSAAVPQFAVTRELDVSGLTDEIRAVPERGDRVTLTDGFIWCVARALMEVPRLNAWYDEGHLHEFVPRNVALAVDTPDGVAAPVIEDVTHRNFLDIVSERARLVAAARSNTLTPPELVKATFTISNVGPLGADALHPMVTPPQTGVLGLGRARPAGSGERRLLTAVLVADHRAVDGADGARFLAALANELDAVDLAALIETQSGSASSPSPNQA
jgi:pyruvate dehydrogenase E2 component (dihydrolipoamide acetyltransferase)